MYLNGSYPKPQRSLVGDCNRLKGKMFASTVFHAPKVILNSDSSQWGLAKSGSDILALWWKSSSITHSNTIQMLHMAPKTPLCLIPTLLLPTPLHSAPTATHTCSSVCATFCPNPYSHGLSQRVTVYIIESWNCTSPLPHWPYLKGSEVTPLFS